MPRLLWSSHLSSMPPGSKHAKPVFANREEAMPRLWQNNEPDLQSKPHVRIPTTISELQDFQDNEQLRRLVQVIVEALLTRKLASLGFTLATPVISQSAQTTQLLPLYTFHLVPILVRTWLCPQKQVPRGQSKVTWRKGLVPKLWQALQTRKHDSAPPNVLR
jgi:hypothetical protein